MSQAVPHYPLLPDDPPQIGPYWLDARLATRDSGTAYAGHDDDGTPALLILLSAGAAADAAARDRLAGAVNQLDFDTVLLRGGHGQDDGRLSRKYFDESAEPTAAGSVPEASWVALAYDESPTAVTEAERILDEVGLTTKPQLGDPAGPAYDLPWAGEDRPGRSRIWPLPWPGRHDRAGWLSLLAAFLLMLLLAALAVLIAILIFRNSSMEQPPPPVQTITSTSTSSSSASSSPSDSSASASPSESSASPSPSDSSQSASPSPSDSSASASPSPGDSSMSASPSTSSGSPTPSGSNSGVGSPTPNSKL
ncbi:MAG: hypothetical protein LBR20_02100 [Propionibacteriaceae bacterium]|nr:hypothetical protein [Propionibacteriaceae bacterium]